jgi:hypothetical protein
MKGKTGNSPHRHASLSVPGSSQQTSYTHVTVGANLNPVLDRRLLAGGPAFGPPWNDTIVGGIGNDGLVGGDFTCEPGDPGSKVPDGNDMLDGGNWNDFAIGMLGQDTVTGGNGET